MRGRVLERGAEDGAGVGMGVEGEHVGIDPRRRCRRTRTYREFVGRRPGALSDSSAMLITVEGLDGAGKTTLIAGLARELGATVLREPGGVELSERIRALVADPALAVDPRAEALLFAAARAQLVAERLRPLLSAGETVLLDRFVDSSLAYQGGGRELGVEAIRALNEFGTGGAAPGSHPAAADRRRPRAWPGSRVATLTGWNARGANSSRAWLRPTMSSPPPNPTLRRPRCHPAPGNRARRSPESAVL